MFLKTLIAISYFNENFDYNDFEVNELFNDWKFIMDWFFFKYIIFILYYYIYFCNMQYRI